MTSLLIRHGLTRGNLEGRYIGAATDELLCEEGVRGVEHLRARGLPAVSRVFASPMRRCLQTAAMLYPEIEPVVIEDLRECAFGAFENKNYAELNGDLDYQRFIDSGGETAFPGGERRADFAGRSVRAFDAARAVCREGETAAFIVHGGTIMAVMERYARPAGTYFSFQIGAGEGFALNGDGSYRRL